MTKQIFFILLCLQTARADNTRKQLDSSYQRSCRAAAYKFYPTMVAYRAPDYQAFAPDGARLDLSNEAERYAILFQSALSVELKIRIEEFQSSDASHCRCRTVQDMRVTRPQKDNKNGVTVVLHTVTRDDWEKRAGGWRLRTRHLLEQAYQDAP